MITFLTSSPGGFVKIDGKRTACGLNESNGFVKRLSEYWKPGADILIVSAAPTEYERNDSIRDIFRQSFPMSHLSVGRVDIWDYRMKEMTVEKINDYDVVILAGGHVPTQNAFFAEIGLREEISAFRGILIGISAGTMNCAEVVYAQPEMEGEAVNPGYQRFLKGLGLTKLMILPHYQDVRYERVDGLRAMEDIAFLDSMGRKFLCLCDGSYVFTDGENATVFGEAYVIEDGELQPLCGQEEAFAVGW